MCPMLKSQRVTANCTRRTLARAAALLLVVLMASAGSFAYSVLTHEEIVDLLWTAEIRPLLLATLSRSHR